MNDPEAVRLLEMAREKGACAPHFAKYDTLLAENRLQWGDLAREDAVWLLGVVRPKAFWKKLKDVAKGHPAMVFVDGKIS